MESGDRREPDERVDVDAVAAEGVAEPGEPAAPEAAAGPAAVVQRSRRRVRRVTGEVLYSQHIGIAPYSIANVPEATLQQWQDKIFEVRQALVDGWLGGNKKAVGTAMTRAGKVRGDVDTIMEMLEGSHSTVGDTEEVHLPDEDLTLMAIGLWVLREKSRWKGSLHAVFKLIDGGRHQLDEFLQQEGGANCIDLAVLVDTMAKRFKIDGDIYVTKGRRIGKNGERFGHRMWKAETGQVIDLSYGWKRAGFFKTEEEFHEYVAVNPDLAWLQRRRQQYVREN